MGILVVGGWHRSHGVVVSTQDFESCDPSSNLGGTSSYQTMNPVFAVYARRDNLASSKPTEPLVGVLQSMW